MKTKIKWRDWGHIARLIAKGVDRMQILEYFKKTQDRHCATAGPPEGCVNCPLHEPGSDLCAGEHYTTVYEWLTFRDSPITRTEALRSARVIAEVTGDD